jgi:hypothetical protein
MTKKNLYTIDTVDEFEYTGGGIWVTGGYVRDTTTGERLFFDSSICPAYAEGVNIYSEYPYYDDDESVEGCTFQPLPNYDTLIRDYFDPDDSTEGRTLWYEILASDAVTKTYASSYLDEFRSALDRDDK